MPRFCRLTCGSIDQSLRRALSTWSTNDCVIHSHWIYIQWPACTFNLSSSSSSVAGTAWSGLRRLELCLAHIAVKRYSTVGQAIPPPLDTFCYSPQTTAPRRNRTSYNPSPPLNLQLHCRVFPSPSHSRPGPRRHPPLHCARCGVVNK